MSAAADEFLRIHLDVWNSDDIADSSDVSEKEPDFRAL